MDNGRIVMQDQQVGDGIEVWDGETRKVVINGLKDGAIGGQIIGGEVYSSKISSLDVPIAPSSQFSALEQFFANLITGEVTRQVNEQMALAKEVMSDLIGTQLDSLKAGEVADAVKAAVVDAKRAANTASFKEIQKRYDIGLKYTDIHGLLDNMESSRRQILSKRTTLRTVRQSLADADLTVKEAEANLLAEITGETLPGSEKPKFSNDKARQSELMARKKIDFGYTEAIRIHKVIRDQAEALEDEVSSLDSDLKTAEMQFHAECRTLEAMTAGMNIYAAALGAGASAGAEWVNVSPMATYTASSAISIVTPGAEQINQVNKNSEPKGW